ncbi:MAG: hypothetical protein U0703_20225 [Anaerolineae bacterium]
MLDDDHPAVAPPAVGRRKGDAPVGDGADIRPEAVAPAVPVLAGVVAPLMAGTRRAEILHDLELVRVDREADRRGIAALGRLRRHGRGEGDDEGSEGEQPMDHAHTSLTMTEWGYCSRSASAENTPHS